MKSQDLSFPRKNSRNRRLSVLYTGTRSCRNAAKQFIVCTHCGNEVTGTRKSSYTEGTPVFCCAGCQTVFNLLKRYDLSDYYKIRESTGGLGTTSPVPMSLESYKFLDDPEFKKKYAKDDLCTMDFYLEGVHCAACLWLVEKLPSFAPEVESASLNIGRSVARIKIKEGQNFATPAKLLEELGYKPHAIEKNDAAEELQKKENRSWLVRIGVAGAASGNIMLMTVPLYAGLNGLTSEYFRWISLALFLPVFFYSAVPFYKSALASVYTRTLSIDLPIVVAILFGSVASVAHLISGGGHIYFDSLAALVFLLLASRYVLRRIQQNAFHSSHLFQFLSPSVARRLENDRVVDVAVHSLHPGDVVQVNRWDVVPVDGVIRSGSSAINCALLTGESIPKLVQPGDTVFSGTVNEGEPIEVEVTAIGFDTRLGKILQEVEKGSLNKAQIVNAADRTARWFLLAVFFAALVAIVLAPNLTEGLSRALALVIVTCPCALALATPLAMSVSLGRASRSGILVKGADVLEKVSQSLNVILDKTGTLTENHFEVLQWDQVSPVARLKDVVHALEAKSKHPIARSIVAFLEAQVAKDPLAITQFKEIVGTGVEGIVLEKKFSIRALRKAKGTVVGIYCENELAAKVTLGTPLRSSAKKSVSRLNALGMSPYILSGDNTSAVEAVATELGIPLEQTLSQATPEEKRKFVASRPFSIMVGDGANDAIALAEAFVGVAVHGSMEVSLRAADVYLTAPGVAPVVKLIVVARETMHTIYRNFAFSLLYNLAGGIAAASGHVTPLFAALLMPLSAFTVFGSSLLGTRKLRSALKYGSSS